MLSKQSDQFFLDLLTNDDTALSENFNLAKCQLSLITQNQIQNYFLKITETGVFCSFMKWQMFFVFLQIVYQVHAHLARIKIQFHDSHIWPAK